MANTDPQKEWDSIWSRFSEVIGFMFDNEGVINSLKRQLHTGLQAPMKKTIKGQIDEVAHLITHHQEELVSLVDKAKKITTAQGKDSGQACNKLKEAIHSLNLEEMKKSAESLKKTLKN
jgi:hypothetical protein